MESVLSMDRETMFQRQRNLNINTPERLIIIGVGGVGSWLAYLAAMSSIRKLVLFDPDVVETSNLGRLPLTEDAVGRYKVDAIAEEIERLRPDCIIDTHPVPFNQHQVGVVSNYCTSLTKIVDCTDIFKVQKLIYTHFPERIRAGYNGICSISLWDRQPTDWVVNDRDGYREPDNVWVGGAVACASLTLMKLCRIRSKAFEFTGDIMDIIERGYNCVEKEN